MHGINVDFGGSIIEYIGDTGGYAMGLASYAGHGNTRLAGNTYKNLTLLNTDYSDYVTFTGSKTYDPPLLRKAENITSIASLSYPDITHRTTVTIPGAASGGYARAAFTSLDRKIHNVS